MAKRKKHDPCPAVFRTDYERIREDLIDQLERNGTVGGHYIDLVNDYMNMWITKSQLDTDIKQRGVIAPYTNANGTVTMKKNESIELVLKVNGQMLKVLDHLGIKPVAEVSPDADEDM